MEASHCDNISDKDERHSNNKSGRNKRLRGYTVSEKTPPRVCFVCNSEKCAYTLTCCREPFCSVTCYKAHAETGCSAELDELERVAKQIRLKTTKHSDNNSEAESAIDYEDTNTHNEDAHTHSNVDDTSDSDDDCETIRLTDEQKLALRESASLRHYFDSQALRSAIVDVNKAKAHDKIRALSAYMRDEYFLKFIDDTLKAVGAYSEA